MKHLIDEVILHDNVEVFKKILKEIKNINHPFEHDYLLCILMNNKKYTFVKILLFFNINLNIRDKFGMTPLTYMCKEGETEIIELMLFNDADVDFPDKFGKTPIFYILEYGHIEIFDLLMNYNPRINTVDSYLKNPIFYAATKLLDLKNKQNMILEYYSKIVHCYIEQGGDINLIDAQNQTTLDLAIANNNYDLVDVLLYFGADYNYNSMGLINLIDNCCINDQGQLLYSILDKNNDIEILNKIKTQMQKVDLKETHGYHNCQEIINNFQKYQSGQNGTEVISDSIFIKGQKDRKDNIKKIIKGITEHITTNITIKSEIQDEINLNNYHIESSKLTKHEKQFKKQTTVLDSKAQHELEITTPNKELNKQLHQIYGGVEESLTPSKIPNHPTTHGIDERFKHGMTKLIMACAANNTELAVKFMNQGADVNKRDFKGTSPIMYAAKNGNVEIVQELINRSAMIDLNRSFPKS